MISYKGIDEADLIHALYHGTRALGMGQLHDKPDLTVEDVRAVLQPHLAKMVFDFDYFYGRPLKVNLRRDAQEFDERLYDRDAGNGKALTVVDGLREMLRDRLALSAQRGEMEHDEERVRQGLEPIARRGRP